MTAVNLLSIDVEDYYMVSAFEGVINREDWELYESRVERNTHAILDLLDSVPPPAETKGLPPRKATFFCLGWVAKRHSGLVKEISRRGHEVASHGWDHRRITSMSPREFRQDVQRSRTYLEDLIGKRVLGYRAPSYSITRETLWALKILAEEGYQYDSSIFPIRHDLYGFPDAPRVPFVIEMKGAGLHRITPLAFSWNGFPPGHRGSPKLCWMPGGKRRLSESLGKMVVEGNPLFYDGKHGEAEGVSHMIEFPPATLRCLGRNLPVAGGGYFRLFPLVFTLWAMKSINKEGLPVTFYLHPWELDPEQPKVKGLGIRSKLRHYLNLERTKPRFHAILEGFHCMPFNRFLQHVEMNGFKVEFRRRWPRIKGEWDVELGAVPSIQSNFLANGKAQLLDISLGGVKLANFQVQQELMFCKGNVFSFRVQNRKDDYWTAICESVRVEDKPHLAVGAKFVYLEGHTLKKLKSLFSNF